MHLERHAQRPRARRQQLLLARDLLLAVHRRPLERRVRLGDVGRHRRDHLRAALVAAPDLLHARRGLDDAEHVLVGLGRQPDHEVELHAREPAAEHAVRRFDDVLFGDVLRDHVAHALRPGLGRERQAPRAHAGHLAQQILVEAVRAQRRHRQRHPLGRQPRHRRLDQRRDARIVGRRQRRQRRLVVAALLDAAQQRVQHRDRIALAHGAVDHPRLAEAAPLGAAARHLDRHAIEDRLGVRQRRVVREREAVDVGHHRALRPRGDARIQRRAHHDHARSRRRSRSRTARARTAGRPRPAGSGVRGAARRRARAPPPRAPSRAAPPRPRR